MRYVACKFAGNVTIVVAVAVGIVVDPFAVVNLPATVPDVSVMLPVAGNIPTVTFLANNPVVWSITRETNVCDPLSVNVPPSPYILKQQFVTHVDTAPESI